VRRMPRRAGFATVKCGPDRAARRAMLPSRRIGRRADRHLMERGRGRPGPACLLRGIHYVCNTAANVSWAAALAIGRQPRPERGALRWPDPSRSRKQIPPKAGQPEERARDGP
jgi:hypothetical protein